MSTKKRATAAPPKTGGRRRIASNTKGAGGGSPSLEPLSTSKLTRIACAASEGKADAADVLQVLDMFYRLAVDNRPIPRPLIDFVAASFGRYRRHKDFYGPDERDARSLDSAFGLLRKKGRPEADEQQRIEMAAEVVRLRLSGTPHQEALDATAVTFGWAKTIVGKAFRDHLYSAVMANRNERPAGFTPDEKRRLATMLKGQPMIESGKIAD